MPNPISNQPSTNASGEVTSILSESRVFQPPAADLLGFKASAGPDGKPGRGPRGWHVSSLDEYKKLHARSLADPEAFWSEHARMLRWTAPWTRVLDWKCPDAKWFVGGRLNACDNCVDRHVDEGFPDEIGLIWEGEPMGADGSGPSVSGMSIRPATPEIRKLTYRELQRETSRVANVLKDLGVKRGEVVTIYMPMVPELAIACLACARIGAVHSVIFGGFAPHAIQERMIDASSRVIITADGGFRRGDIVPLLHNVAEAARGLHEHKHPIREVLVLRRTGHDVAQHVHAIASHEARVTWWQESVAKASDHCPCEPMDSEDMLFLLYTSGSTGKPKGIVHTTGGYLLYCAFTARLTFNLIPSSGQVFWCSADVGWITGHSYVLYGCMANRVATLLYEGAPTFPDAGRFWSIIERHKVTHFYTAPTAIRTFMKLGPEHPAKHDLSSLKVLGTVGEPINPEAWMWYSEHIAANTDFYRRPIVDTYWQTETGGHVITPLPGATPVKPGSCTLPMFGIDAAVVNEQGQELPANTGGLLVIRRPWPGMLRGVHGNRERFVAGYWNRVRSPGGPGLPPAGEPFYFSADGARRDEQGNFWIMGRVDDVINVSGHRLGTMEVESALVSHPAVAEAAVVGMPHDIKGTGICAFVTLKAASKRAPNDLLRKELCDHVAHEIGGIARPDSIRFAENLPKTRSGKIMRRLLRDIAAGVTKITQDTTTLEDYSVVAKLGSEE
ncbi:MAG: acetate--CoA ligase [Planctomycetota bacterium]|nr:acetate--CoA ligase [Planctomycetota bacterium]